MIQIEIAIAEILKSPAALGWIFFVIASLVILAHFAQEILEAGGPIWEYLGLTRRYRLGLAGFIAFAAAQMCGWLTADSSAGAGMHSWGSRGSELRM